MPTDGTMRPTHDEPRPHSRGGGDARSNPTRRRSTARAPPKTQWSWLHATACSSAVVASGAYMHAAISSALDRANEGGSASSALRWTLATLTAGSPAVPWRSLLVVMAMVLWAAGVVVARHVGVQQPLKRAARLLHTRVQRVRAAVSFKSKKHSRRGRAAARRMSSDLEIDDTDLLVVTSLSVERRARRASQIPPSLSPSLSPSTVSSTSSRESSETVDADDEADAQILLHPRDGAKGGRHQSNQIIVDDPYVSRFHFAIGYDPLEKEYFLEDLGSTTGTFVFLKPDVPKRLHVDDRVRLGDSEFEVVAIDENPTTGTPFLRLCFTEGPLCGVGQTIGKTAVTLGRRSSNALCITDDTSISGRHSVISHLGDGFYLTDLQSTNGTALRLSACGVKSARRFLLHGDVFGVGANRFLVEYAHELQLQEKHRALRDEEEALRRAAEHS